MDDQAHVGSTLWSMWTPWGMWAPPWSPLELSRTFRYSTKKSRTFPKPKSCFPLYESYSLDHSGTSRDVRDLIRDSEQKTQ
jgi:hypothetical protein